MTLESLRFLGTITYEDLLRRVILFIKAKESLLLATVIMAIDDASKRLISLNRSLRKSHLPSGQLGARISRRMLLRNFLCI